MKTTVIILTTLLTVYTTFATLHQIFPGYERLKGETADIIIARCPNAPPPTDNSITGSIRLSRIEIVSILKGTNNCGTAILESDCRLQGGGIYLIFGRCENGVCSATEDYRIIPLGVENVTAWSTSITNSIAGKPLNEQLQILFKRRVDDLKLEIQKEQAEKERLEEGLKQ